MRPRGIPALALLAGAGVLLSLACINVTLRHFPAAWKNAVRFDPPNQYLVYDPVLGWKNIPGYRDGDVEINQLSLRGPDYALPKPAHTLRIVCAGDSRTFGTWLDLQRQRYDNAYPPRLQTLLRAGDVHGQSEVINAGVVGYTSAHGLRQFRTALLQLQPDILVASFGFNDHSLAWNTALRSLEPRAVIAREVLYAFNDLPLLQFSMWMYDSTAMLHPAPLTVRWVEPEEYAYNLRRFAALARGRGVRLLFLTQALRPIELGDSPSAFPGAPAPDPYPFMGVRDLAELHRLDDQYRDILYEVAREIDVPVADAARAFAEHQGEPLFSRYDMVHPNLAGAQLIARTVHETLRELDWLSTSDGSSTDDMRSPLRASVLPERGSRQ